MRAAIVKLLSLLVLIPVAVGTGVASAGGETCRAPTARWNVRLPAAVTVTDACGAFRIGPDGTVRRISSDRSPVPAGADWWPYTGVWDKLEHGHLVVGRWRKQLWRSRGRFPVAYQVGVIAISRRALAFSYGNRVPRLYISRLGGAEREVASGEFPLGATGSGFYTRRGDGGKLLLRGDVGTLRATLARQVYTFAYDNTSGRLYFLAHGRVVRAQGATQRSIAVLARLGISATRNLRLQPLGQLLALQERRRLVVLRADGSLFASATLPGSRTRVDGISSQLTAAPDGRAVAFAATSGNTAYGSDGSETVYLLGPGGHAAVAVHREQVNFAVCERGADLAWHGRWLLYSASEGNTALIDTSRPRRTTIKLTRIIRRLPGLASDEGNLDFSAFWSGQPTGV